MKYSSTLVEVKEKVIGNNYSHVSISYFPAIIKTVKLLRL